ncbi:MAG: activase [Myxococcales bacterium]|nr:activase [Myxococcales bacterium]
MSGNAKTFLGIDIGSTNVKLCALTPEDGHAVSRILAHEGDVPGTLKTLLDELFPAGTPGERPRALVTGTEARHRLKLPELIAPVALERGLRELDLRPRAIVSMGGEDLVVYALNEEGRIVSTQAGNKCASGTGEFFRQQLGRMDVSLDDIDTVVQGASVHKLSSRCSVFMKSDCTHRLNKGESTIGDITLSLSKVMADKVGEFLTRTRITKGQVVLVGGTTRNRHIVNFIAESWPEIDVVVPSQAAWFEAFGAALLAADHGAPLPELSGLFKTEFALSYETYPPMDDKAEQVKYVPSLRGDYDPAGTYILGVDGGSTTTKVALLNTETGEIVAEHYGRTHGNPVGALKECIRQVKEQIGPEARPRIVMAATTGSSRELLGVFLQTPAVYNEIIAHTEGTTWFEPNVDTIFEIGGQDAKYVYINNGVPIDYAMNEACSAGTGSFLEESAHGDLNIAHARDIGPLAVKARAPLKFGEHCSAFINSDIRKAIQQGATTENILAGLVFSIVANYLNRVVGNRHIGDHVVLQGGVAKNPAIPLAFAQLTGRHITVPPDPELMGSFGVAMLAKKKMAEGLLAPASFDLDAILAEHIETLGSFVCRSCDNLCEIRWLGVGGKKYPFGGRCSKYTNARKKKREVQREVIDYTQERTRMLFEEFAPDPAACDDAAISVGIPMAFSVHTLWPLYSWFFHSLGVKLVPSTRISPEGIARLESDYCFPAEIAHGAVQDILDKDTDFIFLPFFKMMPSHESGPVHATLCPLTQGLPFFTRSAFNLDERKILRPLIAFGKDWEESLPAFEDMAVQLGRTREQGAEAYRKGIAEYTRFLDAYRAYGDQVLEAIKNDPDNIYVCLLGRPYNAFTRDANMGIPRKFISNNVSVVPFDMIYHGDDEIFPNMYWYYGQQDMKAVRQTARIPNLYPTWVSNFSCAPDSFMLHYLRWMMGQKPYLVLEIDSHSADAGIDTRIEAFLDIVESYRRAGFDGKPKPHSPRYSIEFKSEFADVLDQVTGERIDIRDPRVTLVWSSMGEYSTAAIAAASKKSGTNAVGLPVPDIQTLQLARNVASGKECVPALLVLGTLLQFFQKHPPNQKDEILVVFMPSTLGPCRTGQYFVFYERLFSDLGYENVVLLVGDSSNSYNELGPTFTRDVWWGLILADYFTDIKNGLRLLAEDVPSALAILDSLWDEVLAALATGHELEAVIARTGKILSAIPRRRRLEDLKRVLIVGEIFVRRDTFSVSEITDFLISKDIFPKVTDVTEWIYYTDHCRWRQIKKDRSQLGLAGIALRGKWKEHAMYYVEAFYKKMVHHKVSRHLVPTGLIPDAPHDMHKIIGVAEEFFIDPELESEATVSSGAAASGMLDGYAGAVVISPFACLPGRLVEGVYAPWARERGYPYIALENDGQPYPPNVTARMEIFAHNVSRYEKK